MNVKVSYQEKIVIFDFILDQDDESLLSNPVHINNRSCIFNLPRSIEKNIHPDLLAMSIVLVAFPFIKKSMKLPFSVSKVFSDLFSDLFGIEIGPISKGIEPRAIINGRPGLAYSGGVDSTAALALMPSDTAVVFLDRIIPSYTKTLYDKSAVHGAITDVRKEYETYMVETNMEYMRWPVGFPISNIGDRGDIPLSASAPLTLLADELNLDAISYGIVMESLYMVGHDKYNEFHSNDIYLKWNKIFKSVGIELFFPTSGLSEVATSKISNEFAISPYVRSCMRGDDLQPCKKCIKCFRKLTLDEALVNNGVRMDGLLDNLQSREVIKNLYSVIKHENVYRYITNELIENDFTKNFKKRITIDGEDVKWMERWFPDSIVLVPEKYQTAFIQKVKKYIEVMNDNDVDFVKTWGLKYTSNKNTQKLKDWQEYLQNKITDKTVGNFYQKLLDSQNTVKNIEFSEWIK